MLIIKKILGTILFIVSWVLWMPLFLSLCIMMYVVNLPRTLLAYYRGYSMIDCFKELIQIEIKVEEEECEYE